MLTSLFGRLLAAVPQRTHAGDPSGREAAAHEAILRELETTRQELERRVGERTKELSLITARFETALRGAKVYVFSQDADLRYTWLYNPRGEEAGAEMLGRTDREILPSSDQDFIVEIKRRVLASGKPEDCEVSYVMPEGRVLF